MPRWKKPSVKRQQTAREKPSESAGSPDDLFYSETVELTNPEIIYKSKNPDKALATILDGYIQRIDRVIGSRLQSRGAWDRHWERRQAARKALIQNIRMKGVRQHAILP